MHSIKGFLKMILATFKRSHGQNHDSEKKAKQSSVSDARRLRDWACMHSIKGFLKMTLATFKRSLYKAKEKQQNPTFAEHYFHDSFRSLKTFSFFHEAAFYLCIADLYH